MWLFIYCTKQVTEREIFANANHHSRWNKIQIGFSESTRSTENKTDLQDVSYSACFNVNDFFHLKQSLKVRFQISQSRKMRACLLSRGINCRLSISENSPSKLSIIQLTQTFHVSSNHNNTRFEINFLCHNIDNIGAPDEASDGTPLISWYHYLSKIRNQLTQ